MHQYRIEVYEYSEAGAVAGTPMLTRYADNHEDARLICNEFANQKQTNGMKQYQVKLYVLCYKNIALDTYFAQFQM